jgi:hypothetical protein
MQECGGVIFQLRDSSKFVDPEFPKRITGNWRETWFYASELPADGECPLAAYTSVRSSPRHLSTRNFTPDEEVIIDQMMARVTRLQAQGLSAGHLFNTWAGRRCRPFRLAPTRCGSTPVRHFPLATRQRRGTKRSSSSCTRD